MEVEEPDKKRQESKRPKLLKQQTIFASSSISIPHALPAPCVPITSISTPPKIDATPNEPASSVNMEISASYSPVKSRRQKRQVSDISRSRSPSPSIDNEENGMSSGIADKIEAKLQAIGSEPSSSLVQDKIPPNSILSTPSILSRPRRSIPVPGSSPTKSVQFSPQVMALASSSASSSSSSSAAVQSIPLAPFNIGEASPQEIYDGAFIVCPICSRRISKFQIELHINVHYVQPAQLSQKIKKRRQLNSATLKKLFQTREGALGAAVVTLPQNGVAEIEIEQPQQKQEEPKSAENSQESEEGDSGIEAKSIISSPPSAVPPPDFVPPKQPSDAEIQQREQRARSPRRSPRIGPSAPPSSSSSSSSSHDPSGAPSSHQPPQSCYPYSFSSFCITSPQYPTAVSLRQYFLTAMKKTPTTKFSPPPHPSSSILLPHHVSSSSSSSSLGSLPPILPRSLLSSSSSASSAEVEVVDDSQPSSSTPFSIFSVESTPPPKPEPKQEVKEELKSAEIEPMMDISEEPQVSAAAVVAVVPSSSSASSSSGSNAFAMLMKSSINKSKAKNNQKYVEAAAAAVDSQIQCDGDELLSTPAPAPAPAAVHPKASSSVIHPFFLQPAPPASAFEPKPRKKKSETVGEPTEEFYLHFEPSSSSSHLGKWSWNWRSLGSELKNDSHDVDMSASSSSSSSALPLHSNDFSAHLSDERLFSIQTKSSRLRTYADHEAEIAGKPVPSKSPVFSISPEVPSPSSSASSSASSSSAPMEQEESSSDRIVAWKKTITIRDKNSKLPNNTKVVLLSTNHCVGTHGVSEGWDSLRPSSTPDSEPNYSFSLDQPVLKSLLQKNTRTCRADSAVRTAMQLARSNVSELLRRVLVITVEDGILHPATPAIFWLSVAVSNDFCLTDNHVLLVMQYVHDIAAVPIRDLFPPNESTYPKETLQQLEHLSSGFKLPSFEASLVKSMLGRSAFGGMPFDVEFLRSFALKWTLLFADSAPASASSASFSSSVCCPSYLDMTPGTQWGQSLLSLFAQLERKCPPLFIQSNASSSSASAILDSIGKLRKDDILLSCVDQHCSSIIDKLAGYDGTVRQYMGASCDIKASLSKMVWVFRSSTNFKAFVDLSAPATVIKEAPKSAEEEDMTERLRTLWLTLRSQVDELSYKKLKSELQKAS